MITNFARLEFELFTKPSKLDLLQSIKRDHEEKPKEKTGAGKTAHCL